MIQLQAKSMQAKVARLKIEQSPTGLSKKGGEALSAAEFPLALNVSA